MAFSFNWKVFWNSFIDPALPWACFFSFVLLLFVFQGGWCVQWCGCCCRVCLCLLCGMVLFCVDCLPSNVWPFRKFLLVRRLLPLHPRRHWICSSRYVCVLTPCLQACKFSCCYCLEGILGLGCLSLRDFIFFSRMWLGLWCIWSFCGSVVPVRVAVFY